jgi:predicted DNA-binding transcriptional regulator AlpA
MTSGTSSSEIRETLVDNRAAAAALCISVRKLWQLTQDKQLRCVRIGRAVRYDLADIRRFIEASKTESSKS